MRQEETVVIRRPVSEVFAYVDDPANAPKWAEGITKLEVGPEVPGVVGTTFRMAVKEGRSENWYEGVAIAYEKDRRTRDRVTRGDMAMEMELRYEPVPEGTRVTQSVDIELKGPMKLATPIIWLFNRASLRKQTRKLKELLEAGR